VITPSIVGSIQILIVIMSSNISTDADVLQGDFELQWLQDHEYFALLSHTPAAREEIGITSFSRHPDEIYSNPKSGYLYLLNNFSAAFEFQRKASKGSLCWKVLKNKQVKDKLGLQCVFASASKRGRPVKKGAKTTYTMNIIKSSAHNAVICHLLSQQTSPPKCPPVTIQKQHLLSKTVETPALRKRQKMTEGIDWLLRAATELEEVDYVEMFYSYRQDKFPRLVV
jgi:hypothetical protein